MISVQINNLPSLYNNIWKKSVSTSRTLHNDVLLFYSINVVHLDAIFFITSQIPENMVVIFEAETTLIIPNIFERGERKRFFSSIRWNINILYFLKSILIFFIPLFVFWICVQTAKVRTGRGPEGVTLIVLWKFFSHSIFK